MHCAACSSAIEVSLVSFGVVRSDVNLTTNKMTIEYDDGQVTPEQLWGKVEKRALMHRLSWKKNRQMKVKAEDNDEQRAFRGNCTA
jgi:Cu+-exporting ATPase